MPVKLIMAATQIGTCGRCAALSCSVAAAMLLGITTDIVEAGEAIVVAGIADPGLQARTRPSFLGIARVPPSDRWVELQFDPGFIFDAVARKMAIPLPRVAQMPAIRLASKTSLQDFQRAVAGQWSAEPQVMSNVYSVAQNAIYLDDRAHHPSFDRTLDDVLAHEFVHFFQSRYLGDVELTDDGEEQAVMIQQWFRSRYSGRLSAQQ